MPHVVIRGKVDLVAYALEFSGLLVQNQGDVLRAGTLYLAADGRTALIEGLVVEQGRKLAFYMMISVHDRGSATVRIDPKTQVERSPGVKQLVAEIARDLLAHTPDAEVEVTNLVLPSESSAGGDSG